MILTRRILSFAVAVTMVTPSVMSAAEAAVATWLSPPAGQRITDRNVEVSVGYNTQSEVRVTRLELWIDGQYYGKKALVRPDTRGVCSFWWDTSKTSQGSHDLEVRIYAGNELIATVSGTGTVGQGSYDLRPPTVRFANIKSGDVLKGTANIKLAASDDGGNPPIVTLLVDKAMKLLTNRPPYNYELDTTTYTDGSHELQTYAYDTEGNKSDPAVVKVAFKNNIQRPVVATMSVDTNPTTVAPSEDDGVGALLPPVVVAPAQPSMRTSAAGRTSDLNERMVSSGTPAVPVASAPNTSAKSMSVPASKRVAATLSVKPAIVSMSVVPSELRTASVTRSTGSRPVEPKISTNIESAHESGVRLVSSVSVPGGRQTSARVQPTSGTPAEPVIADSPRSSDVKTVAVLPQASIRSAGPTINPRVSHVAVPNTIDEPIVASANPVSASSVGASIRGKVVARASEGRAECPAISSDEAARAASPRPVRVAMLPELRGANVYSATHSYVGCPPPVQRDTKAKIEKRTIPASGKAKIRDLFDRAGGVVFWDADTHTVVAYAADLHLELKIGSNIAKVNGVDMNMDFAPSLVDGRTIIDAQVFHQAMELAKSRRGVASVKHN